MHPALTTPLLELLGSKYPIVQTGMGWVAGAKLVIAQIKLPRNLLRLRPK